MMRTVDDFFSKQASETLYHYTGIGALLGMVNTRKVWASHAYYLNDSKEILHACDVLKRVLAERQCHDATECEFITQFSKWIDSFGTAFHVFIFSLSKERSLLSQWRSYTPYGKGVSIGFLPRVLNHIITSSDFKLAECLYDDGEHTELMNSLLEKILETFRRQQLTVNTTAEHPSNRYFDFLEKFRGELLQVLAIIKHSAFREERECRLVSPYFRNYTVPEIKFREGASMLLPYIEVALQDDGREELLFDKVTLGPSQDVDLSLSALSSFLSNARVCKKTCNSAIPFRKWSGER